MDWLLPDWPAPPHIHAATTLRGGGVSQGSFRSWNLASHVGDDPHAVAQNRALLQRRLDLPADPVWLHQVHGDRVIEIPSHCKEVSSSNWPPEADAAFTTFPETVCAVLTADCLPILLTDGQTVAAIHGGWRGLLQGILDHAMTEPPWQGPPMAWLGPAIGPQAFEVGGEVKEAFISRSLSFAKAFKPSGGRYLADLYLIAKIILNRYQVTTIHGGNFCTYSDPTRFYSYRREGVCGRMATLVWRSA